MSANATMMHEPIVVEIPSELNDLVPEFMENRRNEIAAIPAALERSEFKQIRIWGHNMAGCGQGYGFPAISEMGRRLETAALAMDSATIRACANELAAFINGVKIVYC